MSEKDINDIERQERAARKKFLWIAVPVWIVLTVFGCWFHLRPGIYVDGDFLYRSGPDCYRSLQTEIRSSQEGDAIRFEAVRDGRETTAVLVWGGAPANENGQQVSLTFQDGTVMEAVWDGEFLTGEDGKDIFFGTVEHLVTVTVNGKRPPLSNDVWSRIFCRLASGETETRGSWLFLFIGTAAYVLGALGFLFPDNTHFFLRRWQYEKTELSDAGRFIEKSGGIIMMIFGGAMMLHLFLLLI